MALTYSFLNKYNTMYEKEQLNYEYLADAISDIEKQMIIKAYEELKSTRKIADKLGISQSTASRLIRKYIQDNSL